MPSAAPRVRTPAHAAIALLAIAITVGACSKGEPESAKPRPNVPVAAPQPAQSPASAPESTEGLRERLARQEAASKMFDKPEPAKPARVEPPSAKAPGAQAPPAKADPPKPEPPKPEPPNPETAKPEPPKPETAKAAPPRAEAKAPPPPPAVTRVVTRVDPEFPREAIQAGAETGTVKARLSVDAGGNVTQVDVTEAVPRRVFDRAVVRALSQWKYNEGAAGRVVDVEVAFKR